MKIFLRSGSEIRKNEGKTFSVVVSIFNYAKFKFRAGLRRGVGALRDHSNNSPDETIKDQLCVIKCNTMYCLQFYSRAALVSVIVLVESCRNKSIDSVPFEYPLFDSRYLILVF